MDCAKFGRGNSAIQTAHERSPDNPSILKEC
jgi:hypothetical protein